MDAGLVKGKGVAEPGKLCVEAAVCLALGLPHGDDPECVGKAVRGFKIALNDCDWSSDAARAKGMRKIAVAQLGSDTIDQKAFAELMALKTIRKMMPVLFRKMKEFTKKDSEITLMEEAAVTCETATDFLDAHKKLKNAIANAIAHAIAIAYANANAYAIAYAYANAYAIAHANANAIAYAYAKDEALTLMADICLECLVELKSPGCKWLDLCEVDTHEKSLPSAGTASTNL